MQTDIRVSTVKPRPVTTFVGGSHPRWSHDGYRVYYNTADGIYEVAVTTSGQT